VLLALAVLAVGTWSFADRMNAPPPSPAQQAASPHPEASIRGRELPPERLRSDGHGALSPALRAEMAQLIRSELRRHAGESGSKEERPTAATGTLDSDPHASNSMPDPLEQHIQARIVDEEIRRYLEKGRISSAEMAALQTEIARLDPEARTAAMRRLVAAINSGELDGRL
jgi:hypothetical protein